MELRRLIIACEGRKGEMPPSFLVASVLHQRGYRLRLFLVGTDSHLAVLLQRLCEQEVTLLDPWLCGSPKNLRVLFQAGADEQALNLILAPLSQGRLEEEKVHIDPLTADVFRHLGGAFVPLIYGDGSSMVTANLAQDVFRDAHRQEIGEPAAFLFASLPNLREYQLLELEMGRRMPALGLGFVPRHLERPLPSLEALLDGSSWRSSILPLRAAAAQLESLSGQIGWPFFSALASYCRFWEESPFPVEPLPARPLVTLLRPDDVDLAGNSWSLFLKGLGCRVVESPLTGGRIAERSDAIILLPGMARRVLLLMATDTGLRSQFPLAFKGTSPSLVMGGSLPPMGKKLFFGENIVRGLGVLPFETALKESESLSCRAEAAPPGLADDRGLLRGKERVRGWMPGNFKIRGAVDLPEPWSVSDEKGNPIPLPGGWSLGADVATPLVLEPWSQPAIFRRWLS